MIENKIRVIEDLTPMLRKLQKEDRADSRPWYEKHWPFMRHGQRIKVISTCGGLLEGRQALVRHVAAKWVNRLSSMVNYDMKRKLVVIEEISEAYDPEEYAVKGTQAMIRNYWDYQGRVITDSQLERVKQGHYLLFSVELLTTNWPRFSVSILERNLVHELLHVVGPEMGLYVKDGRLMEDEGIMRKKTDEILRRHRRRVRIGR